jgi:polar amino acid transport system substrate-binding protein
MNISRRAAMAVIGAGLMAAVASFPATAQTVEEIKSAGTVHIGMLEDVPPFGIMN